MFNVILPNIRPTDKVVKENSTHIAIRSGVVISIWQKGFSFTEEEGGNNMFYKAELIQEIFNSDRDDLLPIFESIEAELRSLRAEANEEFKHL